MHKDDPILNRLVSQLGGRTSEGYRKGQGRSPSRFGQPQSSFREPGVHGYPEREVRHVERLITEMLSTRSIKKGSARRAARSRRERSQ